MKVKWIVWVKRLSYSVIHPVDMWKVKEKNHMRFSLIEWKDYCVMEMSEDVVEQFTCSRIPVERVKREARDEIERNEGEKMLLCERFNNSVDWYNRISFLSWAGKCMPNMNQETGRGREAEWRERKREEVRKKKKELARECERKNKLQRRWWQRMYRFASESHLVSLVKRAFRSHSQLTTDDFEGHR